MTENTVYYEPASGDPKGPGPCDVHAPYRAQADRYANFGYRRVGRSGLLLPPISLGLWYNFGDNKTFDSQREILRYAFDHGITHFDLANNYGPPPGSAEENFGRMMAGDFRPYRHELVISTKAGWLMSPGPHGELGSRKYLLDSLDESLARMRLDYVDIFYSHRFDPSTPLEETIGALGEIARQGKARYVGISSYSPERTSAAAEIAREERIPLVIHQPAYSLLNRWIEDGLTDVLEDAGLGAIAFTPLAQGMLTGKYLGGAKNVERSMDRPSFSDEYLSEGNLRALERLNDIAADRGQTLPQLALAWTLRSPVVASALIGASRVEQLAENLAAVDNLVFSTEELEAIERATVDGGINNWAASSQA